jgi:Cdc6-like AAA superfamily ATPase
VRGSKAQKEEGCMEGTRISVLEDLLRWAADPKAPRIHWITGKAGEGKSAVARSLCSQLQDLGSLGASFFCSRRLGGEERRNAGRIIPSIAHELAARSPMLKDRLVDALTEDGLIKEYRIENQFDSLLVKPREVLAVANSQHTPIVVIDSLDECSDLAEVAALLAQIIKEAPSLPVKFVLFCRFHSDIGKYIPTSATSGQELRPPQNQARNR